MSVKRIIATLMILIMTVAAVTSCGADKAENAEPDDLDVVVTIFPEYDWAREIIGDVEDVDLELLLDNGTDIHSYQPSAKDIVKIAGADVFIYVGGESDEWVDEVVNKVVRPDVKIINLMDVLGEDAKEEELKEGMQGYEHHDEDEDEEEYDEHVWLSLRNAGKIVSVMADAFAEADPDHSNRYRENAKAYIKSLDELDGEYEQAVGKASCRTLLFGDRFPFRYMTEDYGITYYAAFTGCSAETEASFETVTFLANKIDELGLKYVMVIDGSDTKVAETIIRNTRKKNQKILMLDSMQSIESTEVESGTTYLGIMKSNLRVLEEALS